MGPQITIPNKTLYFNITTLPWKWWTRRVVIFSADEKVEHSLKSPLESKTLMFTLNMSALNKCMHVTVLPSIHYVVDHWVVH